MKPQDWTIDQYLDQVQWMYSIFKYFPLETPPQATPFEELENYKANLHMLRSGQISGLPDFYKLHLRTYRWLNNSTYNNPLLVDEPTFCCSLNNYMQILTKPTPKPKVDDTPKDKVKNTNYWQGGGINNRNVTSNCACAICKAAGIPTWRTHNTAHCRNINQVVKPIDSNSLSSVARSNNP